MAGHDRTPALRPLSQVTRPRRRPIRRRLSRAAVDPPELTSVGTAAPELSEAGGRSPGAGVSQQAAAESRPRGAGESAAGSGDRSPREDSAAETATARPMRQRGGSRAPRRVAGSARGGSWSVGGGGWGGGGFESASAGGEMPEAALR